MKQETKAEWVSAFVALISCVLVFVATGCAKQPNSVTLPSQPAPRQAAGSEARNSLWRSQRCDQNGVVCSSAEWQKFEAMERAAEAAQVRTLNNSLKTLTGKSERLEAERPVEDRARRALEKPIPQFVGSGAGIPVGTTDEYGYSKCLEFNSEQERDAARHYTAPRLRDCSVFQQKYLTPAPSSQGPTQERPVGWDTEMLSNPDLPPDAPRGIILNNGNIIPPPNGAVMGTYSQSEEDFLNGTSPARGRSAPVQLPAYTGGSLSTKAPYPDCRNPKFRALAQCQTQY